MTKYEELLLDAEKNRISVVEKQFKSDAKGLCKGDKIGIRRDLPTNEKACVLAEELGHYHTTVGEILDQSRIENAKQEQRARAWAYDKLIPPDVLRDEWDQTRGNLYEMAERLDVPVEFLRECMEHYSAKLGPGYLDRSQLEGFLNALKNTAL